VVKRFKANVRDVLLNFGDRAVRKKSLVRSRCLVKKLLGILLGCLFLMLGTTIWALAAGNTEQKLRELLVKHVSQGGKEEVVVYCHTGHTAGLVAGVLGTRGFNIKNLQYGFDLAWTGTLALPPPIKAPVEDKFTPGEKEPDCG